MFEAKIQLLVIRYARHANSSESPVLLRITGILFVLHCPVRSHELYLSILVHSLPASYPALCEQTIHNTHRRLAYLWFPRVLSSYWQKVLKKTVKIKLFQGI